MNSLAHPPSFHSAPVANTPFQYPAQQHQQQQLQQAGSFYPQFAGQGFGYGANDGAGASTSTPPPGGMLQGPPINYTSAPALSLPPQQQQLRPSASPPIHQQQQQQPQPNRQSPPNAAPQNPTPPSTTTKYPMAAPPLPNTPSSATNPPAASTSSPRTPLSPTSESREQQRIAHLLTLNSALLSEISALQSAGQGGVLNPAQAEAARQKGLPDKMASEDYIHTMRRVQANIQYLMHKQQPGGSGAKLLPGPAIMTAPPHLGERLKGEYDRLRELFPEWNGIERAGGGTPGRQNSGQAQGQMPNAPQQA